MKSFCILTMAAALLGVATTAAPALERPLAPTVTATTGGTTPFPSAPGQPQLTPQPLQVPAAGPLPAGFLVFDSESKEYTAKPGELEAKFTFNVTNVSSGEVVVNNVQTSCGCTVAHLTYPWKIPAGGNGEIPVTMNLAGKSGVVFKSVTIQSDKGMKPLMVKTTILAPDPQAMGALDRERNQLLAKTDRQAVFKGDCARCHVEPVIGKVGKDLYTTACGVCHESEHRATMVPDLYNLATDTTPEYWKMMASFGKPGTLMPAFAQIHGGPLSDAQVTSLVEYLVATMPAKGTNSRPYIEPAKRQASVAH